MKIGHVYKTGFQLYVSITSSDNNSEVIENKGDTNLIIEYINEKDLINYIFSLKNVFTEIGIQEISQNFA